jgi:hypothetical protein
MHGLGQTSATGGNGIAQDELTTLAILNVDKRKFLHLTTIDLQNLDSKTGGNKDKP